MILNEPHHLPVFICLVTHLFFRFNHSHVYDSTLSNQESYREREIIDLENKLFIFNPVQYTLFSLIVIYQ